MRRAFARKTETLTPRKEEEFGWLAAPEVNEVSPASVWGFEEETRFENPDVGMNSLGEKQSYAPEAPASDTNWWSKPDLSEEPLEATEEEVPTIEFQAPEVIATPSPEITHEHLEPVIEEPEEDYPVTPAYAGTLPEVYGEELPEFEDTIAPESVVSDEPEPLFQAKEPQLPSTEPSSQPAHARPVTVPRPRVLDESVILPHEVSFATISLEQKTLSRSYSPAKEFSVKFAAGLKKYSPMMLLIAVFAAAIAYSLKFKSLDDNVPTQGIQNATAAPVRSQTQNSVPVTQPEPKEPATPQQASVVPKEPEKPANPPVETNPVATKVAANASEKTEETPKTKPAGAEQSSRPITKTAVAKRPVVSTPKEGKDEPPATQAEKRAASTADAEPKSREPESDTRAVPSGGGDRPRRVSAPPNSQSNSSGTQTQKPKLIDWP
jgi:hypothetical protein